MQKETVTFVGYQKIDGKMVAEFRRLYPEFDWGGNIEDTFIMDKPSCELRLKNLKKGGHPHDQTALALEQWPTDEQTMTN